VSDTATRCDHEGIKEFPRVTIEKYSPDQTAWAERRLHEELSWGRRLLVSRFGARVPRLHGDWLREVFAEPEDGYAYAEGNQMVTNGLENLVYLLLGTTASGGFGRQMTNAQSGVGVGATATAATYADTHLGADGGSAYYQQMDATYPSYAGSGTANGGQINGQSTFASGNGNFAWNEWCWFTFTSTITAGATLASVASNTNMFNHKIASLGTKGSGASWVFSTTCTFS
jgi:hypothetical protein